MEKEVELFDKRFVYFMWDDSLEGKDCFVADNIDDLIFAVRNDGKCGVKTNSLRFSSRASLPFLDSIFNNCYPFAYFDPHYEVKRAYLEGKTIQYTDNDGVWEDTSNPCWLEGNKYRVKPEEDKCIVYLFRRDYEDSVNPYLTYCIEQNWEMAQKDYGAKTKLFVGMQSDCEAWIESRKKFVDVIKAWEDGKVIQYKNSEDEWRDYEEPFWDVNTEYRVKPECPCEEGVDSKACVDCEHSEDGKMFPTWMNPRDCNGCLYEEKSGMEEPCSDCVSKRLFIPKKYRPFKDCDELVKYWTEKYQSVARPANTMPLIWVRRKEGPHRFVKERNVCLITGFDNDTGGWGSCVFLEDVWIDLKELFDDFEFLDGSPVGMEVKE